jgi:hypothetical protein
MTKKGVWYDFVSGAGGVLDLIQHVPGGSHADALKFGAEANRDCFRFC